MNESPIQTIFLKELIESIRAGRSRVSTGLADGYSGPDEGLKECFDGLKHLSKEEKQKIERIVWDELRGQLHGFLVTLDGGTALADHGLVRIVDEDGIEFCSHLHEIAFSHLTDSELET